MQNQSQIDKANQSIEASGATLEDALREASIQLGIPVKKMVYEVIQKGGVSGLKGKAPWRITAYAQAKEAAIPSKYEEDFIFGDAGKNAAEEVKNKDGQVCVRRQPDGIFMKVIPPTGTGKKASLSIAKEILLRRKIDNYDFKNSR